ncbi:hypothetical protein [Roseomonas rosulenta]|uniref:hypothetical protein n=1 Tax=Roseomonas rosulenta TaxID=2748667 RepID=UPI0018DFBB33|nr:hypothetical protein [Roseomonas rosulenta]
MTAIADRLARRALLLGLLALPCGLAGCAAAPERAILVEAGVTGALRDTIRESRRPDAANSCGWLHVSGFGTGGAPIHFMLWEIVVAPAGGQDGFRLSFPMEQAEGGPRPARAARVQARAGGRAWEGSAVQDDFTAEVTPGRGFATGRFVLRGLRPEDGGEGRIDLVGRWSCPEREPG